MAGAGFKTFNTGDVLTASDVNTYLMQQTVMVFASAAARTTALGANVAEGMLSYLKDTDVVEVYNGSAWVSSDDPNAIQNTIVDAKGDIITATAADTPARLAVGSNGYTLVADSSQTTGLGWSGNQAAGRNVLLNSNFDIAQRGTSFTGISSTPYTLDRWRTIMDGTSLNVTVTQDSSVPNSNSKNSIKVQQISNTATTVKEFGIMQLLETQAIEGLCGKTVVLSFWYKSNLTGSHYARVYASGQTGGTSVTTAFTVNAANTWEFKTITYSSFAAVTAIATALTAEGAGVQIGYRTFGGGSATSIAANDYVQFSQMQLEAGSTPTPYTLAGGTIQGELAACRRYLPAFSGANFLEYIGYAYGTNTTVYTLPFDVPARVAPTGITVAGTINVFALNTSTAVTPTFNSGGVTAGSVLAAPTITAGQGSRIQITSGASILFTGCEL